MTEHNNKTDKHYQLYVNVAKQMNAKLPHGKVTVIRTDNMSKYCDVVSLEMDDDLYEMIHGQHDNFTKTVVFDTLYKVDKREYYIEPYNKYLLNLAF